MNAASLTVLLVGVVLLQVALVPEELDKVVLGGVQSKLKERRDGHLLEVQLILALLELVLDEGDERLLPGLLALQVRLELRKLKANAAFGLVVEAVVILCLRAEGLEDLVAGVFRFALADYQRGASFRPVLLLLAELVLLDRLRLGGCLLDSDGLRQLDLYLLLLVLVVEAESLDLVASDPAVAACTGKVEPLLPEELTAFRIRGGQQF